jgi:hypothetical protein
MTTISWPSGTNAVRLGDLFVTQCLEQLFSFAASLPCA